MLLRLLILREHLSEGLMVELLCQHVDQVYFVGFFIELGLLITHVNLGFVHLSVEVFEDLVSVGGYFLESLISQLHIRRHRRHDFREFFNAPNRCLQLSLHQIILHVELSPNLLHVLLRLQKVSFRRLLIEFFLEICYLHAIVF